MFKIKDRVYDLKYGWGRVIIIYYDTTYPISVRFDNDEKESYTLNGCPTTIGTNRTLFFAESKFENLDEMVGRKEEWKPKEGELFYHVSGCGEVNNQAFYDNDRFKHKYMKYGNCFESEEDARDSKFYKVFHGE